MILKNKKIKGVYFLHQSRSIHEIKPYDYIKIGYSKNYIKNRKTRLESMNPNELTVIGNIPILHISLEGVIQNHFNKYNIKNEWFYYTEELKKFIKKINTLKENIDNLKLFLESYLNIDFNNLKKIHNIKDRITYDELKTNLSFNLKRLRKNLGISQEKLAISCKVDRRGYQRMENKEEIPDIRVSTLYQFMKFYNVNFEELISFPKRL